VSGIQQVVPIRGKDTPALRALVQVQTIQQYNSTQMQPLIFKKVALGVTPIALTPFFGIDGNGSNDRPNPMEGPASYPNPIWNSDFAYAEFRFEATDTNPTGVIATQDFEAIAPGPAPIAFNLNPGAVIGCTITGTGSVINIPVGTTDGFGRYSIPSATSTRIFLAVAAAVSEMAVEFDTDVNGFGFYATDIGDFGGQLELDFQNASGQSLLKKTISVASIPGAEDGNCLFFGALSAAPVASNKFRKVVFKLIASATPDGFGFDHMTIVRIP